MNCVPTDRHSDESRNPGFSITRSARDFWTPAFAGVTTRADGILLKSTTFPRNPRQKILIMQEENPLGEIRSTLDLIMDKTRGMSLSQAEKESLHMEELRKRANGFKIRLLDDPSRTDEILATLDNEPESDRRLLHSLLWNTMLDTLPADEEILKYLHVMEMLPAGKAKATKLHELRASFRSWLKTRGADRKKVLARERKKLAAAGISGSAVVPKIPKGSSAEQGFEQELGKLKTELMTEASVAR